MVTGSGKREAAGTKKDSCTCFCLHLVFPLQTGLSQETPLLLKKTCPAENDKPVPRPLSQSTQERRVTVFPCREASQYTPGGESSVAHLLFSSSLSRHGKGGRARGMADSHSLHHFLTTETFADLWQKRAGWELRVGDTWEVEAGGSLSSRPASPCPHPQNPGETGRT